MTRPVLYITIDDANERILELEAELSEAKKTIKQLEDDKLWLQDELDRERNRQWAKE